MDPVSHLILGRALAALTPRPAEARGLTTAIVIASIAPDADAVLMPTGWDRYLMWHQRGTHALIGTAADALVLAGLLWVIAHLLERRRQRTRGSTSPETADPAGAPAPAPAAAPALARFTHLWLAAWIGCLGHITLDLVSGGTIRLFEPFDATPFGLPLTAMADPLIALPLLAFLLAVLIWRRHARPLAIGVLCVLAGVLVVKRISELAAYTVFHRAFSDRAWVDAPELRAVEARWGSVFGWMFYDRSSTHLRAWTVDAWTGAVTLDVERATAPPAADAALVAASRNLETVRHLFSLFDLTFVETRRRGDVVDVLWTDIRFCGPAGCPLWFGGTFDADGRPREQVVIIGAVRQTRPI